MKHNFFNIENKRFYCNLFLLDKDEKVTVAETVILISFFL